MKRLRPHLPFLSVCLIAIALVIYKWPFLSLPAYWDEGFPYIYGIRYLHDHSLTMLPNGMPDLYSTGHPTLFYFLSAGWMRIFGTDIGMAHIFPLLISVLLLFAVFRFGKRFAFPNIGATAAFLLGTRTIFITQSSFLLPETLLALFAILAIHAWLEDKKGWYVLWASLLVLTKEPGIVLVGVIGLLDLIHLVRNFKTGWRPALIKLAISALPVIPFILFFIIQKIQMGWFFFPRHINSFNTTETIYFDKLIKCFSSHFFVYYGGIVSSAILVVSVLFLKIKNAPLLPIQKKLVTVVVLFSCAFILFSSFSFSIPRYLLCLYGPWFVMLSILFTTIFSEKRKAIAYGILIATGLVQIGYAYDIRSMADYDLGYTDVLKTQVNAVRWSIDHGYRDKKIFTTQQLERGMESDASGFVKKENVFTQVDYSFDSATALFIFTCTENGPQEEAARKLPLTRMARFESGKAWTEIYSIAENE